MPKVALVVHGILAIIFILLAVVLIANYRFKQSVKREVEELFKDNLADKAEIVRQSRYIFSPVPIFMYKCNL
jgi:hypothetical protein